MSADPYTFVNVPAGTVTRMEISDTTARAIVAEYGGEGWRVCQMGKVIVLHTAPEGEINPASHLEHAVANLLHAYQNGVELNESMFSYLSDALDEYRKGSER